MSAYWLLKTEPETYSYEDLVREKEGCWDGVRNFEARNYLRQMKKGDNILIYYSGKERAIVGLGKVSRSAYPDPTASGRDWSAIDLKPERRFPQSVSLSSLRSHPVFQNCLLLRRSRLSVMPFSQTESMEVLHLAGLKK